MSKLETVPTVNNDDDLGNLAFAVQRMQACIQHSTNAFEGSSSNALGELKEMKRSIYEALRELQEPLKNTKRDLQSLEEISRALAVIPDKIADELARFPGVFSDATEEAMSNVAKIISDSVGNRISQDVTALNNEIMSYVRTYNEEVQAATSKFRGDNNQIHHDLKYELQKYTDGLERIIDRSDSFRIKNMMYNAVLCSALSALISTLTVWYMVS